MGYTHGRLTCIGCQSFHRRYYLCATVTNKSFMKQVLDRVMFNIDEIILVLQLFYFQAQDDLVYKKVHSVIVNLLHPVTNLSQIDHNVLVDTVIRVFEEYDSTDVKTFKGHCYWFSSSSSWM